MDVDPSAFRLVCQKPRLVSAIARLIALRAVRSLGGGALRRRTGALGRCPKPRKGHCPLTLLRAGICAVCCHRSPHSPAGCSLAGGYSLRRRTGALGRCPKPRKGQCPLTLLWTGIRAVCCHRSPHSPAGCSLAFAMYYDVKIWGSTPNPGRGFTPAP